MGAMGSRPVGTTPACLRRRCWFIFTINSMLVFVWIGSRSPGKIINPSARLVILFSLPKNVSRRFELAETFFPGPQPKIKIKLPLQNSSTSYYFISSCYPLRALKFASKFSLQASKMVITQQPLSFQSCRTPSSRLYIIFSGSSELHMTWQSPSLVMP